MPVALAALMAIGLSTPRVTSACTCAPETPGLIGTLAEFADIVVFSGTVASVAPELDASGHTVGRLAVHQVFKGDLPAEVSIIGGNGADCTIRFEPGVSMITAANYDAGELTPNVCMPRADPDSALGRQLIAEAIAAYGPGRAPPGPATSDAPAPLDTPAPYAMAVTLSALVALAIVLLGMFAVLRRRRRRSG